jgi:hypothetical protein
MGKVVKPLAPRGLPEPPFWKRVCNGGRRLPTVKPAPLPVVSRMGSIIKNST